MATQLFLLNTVASTHRGTNTAKLNGSTTGWRPQALGTSRSSSFNAESSNTVLGTTLGVEVDGSTSGGTAPFEFLSEPVAADVTISGTITANIWASESDMNANVAVNVVIDILRSDLAGTIVQIVKSTRVTEAAITTRAVNNFTTGMTSGYTPQTLNRGDRLRIRVFADDVGTMGAGFSFSVAWGATSAATDGDSYVTFTENLTFESAPGGTVIYLTNEQSGLSAAPALISDFTGADENPLSEGGNWANINSFVGSALQRISNAVGSPAAAFVGSYWTPANFGPDLEAYFTISTHFQSPYLFVRVQNEGGSATWDGYGVSLSGGNAQILRFTNAASTTLITGSGVTWASGDKLGVRCEGSTIQLWRQASGSSTWNLLLTAVDATYPSAGKVGIGANNTTVRIDDFYVATDSNLFTQKAWTSRGAGVVSFMADTDAGWVTPLLAAEWFTPQLQAVTLGGMAVANIRALESNIAANASLGVEIARVSSTGTSPTVWAYWCMSANNARLGEVNTTQTAETVNISGDDLAISDGERLRIRLYLDDTPDTAMGASQTVTTYYNGTSGGASGDSYITFPVTLTEYTAPAAGGPAPRRQRRASRFLTIR